MEQATVRKLVEKFLRYLKVERNRSPRTIKAYRYDLGRLLEFLDSRGITDIQDVDGKVIEDFYYSLEKESVSPSGKVVREGNSSISRARKLSAIRSFFKFLYRKEIIDTDPSGRVDSPSIEDKEAAYLTEKQVKHLLDITEKTSPRGSYWRDYAIILTFVYAGLRLSELVMLNVGDVDLEDGGIKLNRKGRKIDFLPLNEELGATLREYVGRRKRLDAKTDALFLSKLGNRLSPRSVHYIVKKYLRKAGFTDGKYSAHSLRHTFISLHFKRGTPLSEIQRFAGHKQIQTTQIYIHSDWDSRMRKSANNISLQLGGYQRERG